MPHPCDGASLTIRPAGVRAGAGKGRKSKDFEVNPRIYEIQGAPANPLN